MRRILPPKWQRIPLVNNLPPLPPLLQPRRTFRQPQNIQLKLRHHHRPRPLHLPLQHLKPIRPLLKRPQLIGQNGNEPPLNINQLPPNLPPPNLPPVIRPRHHPPPLPLPNGLPKNGAGPLNIVPPQHRHSLQLPPLIPQRRVRPPPILPLPLLPRLHKHVKQPPHPPHPHQHAPNLNHRNNQHRYYLQLDPLPNLPRKPDELHILKRNQLIPRVNPPQTRRLGMVVVPKRRQKNIPPLVNPLNNRKPPQNGTHLLLLPQLHEQNVHNPTPSDFPPPVP